ncbi:MAG: GrpB family protein [Kiritimatiellae bacterium]|nr:GrpB family protein [Kiritimatiellia bacterium]
MGKELSEMSLEDLWKLFPIVLVEPDGKWAEDYREMEILLEKLFAGRPIRRISHIGSTAIKGIWAKNIVDVLVEVPESCGLEDLARILERNGFAVMSAGAARISLNKGYTPNGFADKVYHIHLRHAGDNGELYFRDYLNEHPDAAKEYESLKLRLWKRHEHDRDAYTDAKGGFVAKWTAEARKEYGGRY